MDPDDILKGKGFFLTNNLSLTDWVMNSSVLTTDLGEITGSQEFYLQIDKNTDANLSFQDGLILSFNSSKPRHVRFNFAPSYVDQENTNLRLKNSVLGTTALSFRCGNAGFLRVNDNQMVAFYNDTISTVGNIIRSKVSFFLRSVKEFLKRWT